MACGGAYALSVTAGESPVGTAGPGSTGATTAAAPPAKAAAGTSSASAKAWARVRLRQRGFGAFFAEQSPARQVQSALSVDFLNDHRDFVADFNFFRVHGAKIAGTHQALAACDQLHKCAEVCLCVCDLSVRTDNARP